MLRGAAAGGVAAGIWALQQPLDKRAFRSRYDDAELLGRLVVRDGDGWVAPGVALHVQNGAAFGADISGAVPLPEHGVITVFATLPNTKIEFIQPLGEDSPIAKFVERNPDGGIHHICYEVPEIIAARDKLIAEGARVLGDGNPKIGAHGKPVLFLHPKDFSGALVEIEQS